MSLRRLTGIVVFTIFICHVLCAAPPEVHQADLPRTPPSTVEQALAKFEVRPGFRLEAAASEPLVVDPVAIAFDADSRAYVAEMRDYSERRDEKLGRIKLLADDNDDGVYDRAVVFAEGLAWPTAAACWDGGVFVVASPELLYLKDTDGDDRADVRALVFTGFGNLTEKLNVQALPNSLVWGPDQRFHLALGGNASKVMNFAKSSQKAIELRGRDLSFDPRVLEIRAEPGGGQWGQTFDELGRKFVCSNSRHIQQFIAPEFTQRSLSNLANGSIDIAVDGPQAEVFRVSPVEPWRVLRTQWRVNGIVPGLIEGGGRASGYFTSACGITIYGGDAYPREYLGNAFIADCGSNLIHRKVLSGEVRRSAARAADETEREFLASHDQWFRPVALANAPDGCLWACDMYRETVEHPWSIPEGIKKHLDLNSGNDRGRLWRIVPQGYEKRPAPKLSRLSDAELVKLLGHANVWHRETAARLLHERSEEKLVPELFAMIATSEQPTARSMALRVAAGKQACDERIWFKSLRDESTLVKCDALTLLGGTTTGELSPGLFHAILKCADDRSDDVRLRVCYLARRFPAEERVELLQRLAQGNLTSSDFRNTLAAAAENDVFSLWKTVRQSSDRGRSEFARELIESIGKQGDAKQINAALDELLIDETSFASLLALAEGTRRGGKSLATIASSDVRSRFAAHAVQMLAKNTANSQQRMQALQVLGVVGSSDHVVAIVGTIQPTTTSGEVSAAIQALDRIQPPRLGELYLSLWPRLPSGSRAELIQTWRSRPALVPELIATLKADQIRPADISPIDIAAIRNHPDAAVKQEIERLFGAVGTREAAWETHRSAFTKTGSATEGRILFRAKCATCHRKQGEGNAVGPDLDAAASAGKEKLLTNILDPSREITAGYLAATVHTNDGESISGVIASEGSSGVTLKIPGKPPRMFALAEIEELQRSPKSLMPDGLESQLTPQDTANLLEYLVTTRALPEARLPLDRYRNAEGKITPLETAEHWKMRRREILAKMQEIMGPLPSEDRRCDLAPEILEEVEVGSYIRRLITFAAEPGSRVPAYVLIPKKAFAPDAAKCAAVLCLHPTDNTAGHRVVAGLGGKANRQYAAELAERGFVTIAPAYPLLANYQPDLAKLGYASGTMKAIWDNRRALDYLETLPFVEKKGFGAIGHSLGGHNSVYTAAFDDRITAVVSSCGLDSYVDYKRGDITGWTSTRYMPRLAAYRGRVAEVPFDLDEILASLAPRAVRIVAPLGDDNFSAASVDRIAENAHSIYRLLNAEQKLMVEHPDCGHDFPDAARISAYEFLERELRGR